MGQKEWIGLDLTILLSCRLIDVFVLPIAIDCLSPLN